MLTNTRIRRLRESAKKNLESNALVSIEACNRLFSAGIKDEYLLEIIVRALYKLGKFDRAISYLEELLAFQPSRFEYTNQLVDCFKLTANYAGIATVYNNEFDNFEKDIHWILLANKICNILKKHAEAEHYSKLLVAYDNTKPEYHSMLGWHQQSLGKIDEAVESYEQAISINPQHVRARYTLSTLKKQSLADNHISALEKLALNKSIKDFELASLYSALGKEYEDIGQFDKAFHYFSSSAQLRNCHQQYGFEADTRVHKAMQYWFTQSLERYTGTGCNSINPIFIVGMPRTGSTLLDRILSSHSKISSAGELMCFRMAFQHVVGGEAYGNFFEDFFENAAPIGDLTAVGERYATLSSPMMGETPYFIDKMPRNYFFLGFIAMALPKAKFIVSQRGAMDTCFSNFKQLFGDRFYSYSYDLINTADHFSIYQKTINFWKNQFKDRIYIADYERLIENIEGETEALLNFVGVPFEQECVNFYNNKKPVDTASSTQVRQPLYSSSVEKWKCYEQHLVPLKNRLIMHGIYS